MITTKARKNVGKNMLSRLIFYIMSLITANRVEFRRTVIIILLLAVALITFSLDGF